MKLNAYILAADPGWLQTGVTSIYPHVEKIVVSYDRNGRGWTGKPVPVEECLELLRAIDGDKKMEFLPGEYAQCDPKPLRCETIQRTDAIAKASEGADWIVQLDSDEVLGEAAVFLDCIQEAEAKGYGALEFPSRWILREYKPGWFLERCTRSWRPSAAYPGPLAIKVGTELKIARQTHLKPFRVDFRARNTDPWRGKNAPIHRVITPDQGVLHFTWARTQEYLERKFGTWGHALDRADGWNSEMKFWMWAGKHPYMACLKTPVADRNWRFRPVNITPPAGLEEVWGK